MRAERAAPRRRRGPAGVALIATVTVLALLAVLVVFLGRAARLEDFAARNRRLAVQERAAAESAAEAAVALIARHHGSADAVDALDSPWAAPLRVSVGLEQMAVEVTDEDRRLDVNALYSPGGKANPCPAALERLFEALWRDRTPGERLADWVDADEEGPFEQGAKNAPLGSLGEMFDIPDVAAALAARVDGGPRRVVDHLTIYADGQVNVNTAPEAVLYALTDDASLAARFVARRAREPFRNAADVRETAALFGAEKAAWLGRARVRSHVFRLRVWPASQADGAPTLEGVVRLGGDGGAAWLARHLP